jgi:DNA primase
MASPFTEVQVGDRTIKVSNPARVYFAERGETKLDLVNYYLAVGEGIERALFERPCTLKRFPKGAEGEAIYQKRVPKGAPEWLETAHVSFPSGRSADELCYRAGQRHLGGADVHHRVPSVALPAP